MATMETTPMKLFQKEIMGKIERNVVGNLLTKVEVQYQIMVLILNRISHLWKGKVISQIVAVGVR